jgi:hypothetical protein
MSIRGRRSPGGFAIGPDFGETNQCPFDFVVLPTTMAEFHVQCPNCAAPLTVADVSIILECGYCGAHSPLPDRVKNDPLWIRAQRVREINAWYERSRAELLETDASGNRRPPTKECPHAAAIFLACGAAGFVLSIPVLLVSLLFPPAFLLVAVTFFGPGLAGLLWSNSIRTKVLDRYRRFQEVEAKYQARLAAAGT